ncbi:hypothetical protein ACJX0J_023971 [Zea mays]
MTFGNEFFIIFVMFLNIDQYREVSIQFVLPFILIVIQHEYNINRTLVAGIFWFSNSFLDFVDFNNRNNMSVFKFPNLLPEQRSHIIDHVALPQQLENKIAKIRTTIDVYFGKISTKLKMRQNIIYDKILVYYNKK